MLKSLQKQLQRRHRQWCLEIDTLFQLLMFSDGRFIASSVKRKQCVGTIFGTPGTTYLHYNLVVSSSVYSVFSLRIRASDYTWRLIMLAYSIYALKFVYFCVHKTTLSKVYTSYIYVCAMQSNVYIFVYCPLHFVICRIFKHLVTVNVHM